MSQNNSELTARAIGLGLFLSVVMAAANVYLGLKAGMTVSASIPAAVMAMGILRLSYRPGTVLESNLIQTAASAGESLAAGIIFTMPALVIAGIWQTFNFWMTSFIALTGGLLGILLMIPMRKVFITNNDDLPYPEGVACAEVLTAGNDAQKGGAKLIFIAILISGLIKFLGSFFGLLKSAVEGAMAFGGRVFYFGSDISPALASVGFIVGLPVSILIFSGGAAAWLIGIPLLGGVGENPMEHAWELWGGQIRYVGVGAMVVAGVESIYTVRMGLVSAVKEMRSHLSNSAPKQVRREDTNLNGKVIMFWTLFCVAMILGIYYYATGNAFQTVFITAVMLFLAFFFTAVASYIVGLIGNSNSPVSGMTITAVLVTAGLLYILGYTGTGGMLATLIVAGVVCCVACTSGDVCNDLKTGALVGATPRNQQIMQIAGVLVASFSLAPVLIAMHEGSLKMGGTGIGGRDYPAPQANLFANLANGIFGEGQLPWNMIGIGVIIGIALIVLNFFIKNKTSFRFHLMPVAVGVYLPLSLSTPILLGGIVAYLVEKNTAKEKLDDAKKKGILVSSGLIAGESLIGVGLALLAYFNFAGPSWAKTLPGGLITGISIIVMAGVLLFIYRVARNSEKST